MKAPAPMSRKSEEGEATGNWAPARLGSVLCYLFAFAVYPLHVLAIGPAMGTRDILILMGAFLIFGTLLHTGALGGLAEKAGGAAIGRFLGKDDS